MTFDLTRRLLPVWHDNEADTVTVAFAEYIS